MMKNALKCVLIFLLMLTSCASQKPAAEPVLQIGGATLDGAAAVDSVLNALGGAYEYAEAISCVYEGMDKTYTYPDAVVYTYPDGETDRLMELYCTGGDVKTPAGVTFGDTREKIIDTYGDGFVEKGIVLAYEQKPSSPDNEPASLYFELSDGKVAAIAITTEHRSE